MYTKFKEKMFHKKPAEIFSQMAILYKIYYAQYLFRVL